MTAPTRTVVHLLRHGEVHNPEGVLYGRLDGYRLSDLGRQMAETVGRHLADHDITLVVASSLIRAQETAAPIAAEHGLDVVTDDRVIESVNLFEGERINAGPAAFAHPRHWAKLVNPFKPSWGEAYELIATRMLAAIDDARLRPPRGTRPSSSPTSCPSGPCATGSWVGASGTTRATASARSPR